MGFLEDVMLFVVKGLLLMRIVEFIWLQRLTYKLCPGKKKLKKFYQAWLKRP